MYDVGSSHMSGTLPSRWPEAALLAAHRAGQRAWPGVALSAEHFASHLAAVLPPGSTDIPPELYAVDMFLACACARGDARALDLFSTRILATVVPPAVARISSSPVFVEELMQSLRELLLVPRAGGPARIAEYRGKGPLAGWVRISAVRAAIRMKAHDRRYASADERDLQAIAPGLGPELEYLTGRYRPLVEEALREALIALSERDRGVLRDHYGEGLSIDDLGARHGVHRATAARWIASARGRLLEDTRRRVAERVCGDTADVDSLMQLVASQLELSMRRLGG
jgi:RNA polymerase sigma-70 factor (ECF subfamily)